MRVGVDIGGHTLVTAFVSEHEAGVLPRIEKTDSAVTPPGRGAAEVMDAITEAVLRLGGAEDISSIGLAVPGFLDAERRHSLRLPNFPPESWDGLDVSAALREAFSRRGVADAGIDIHIENDANCYALGEGMAGAAVGVPDFVTFTLGTGIGSGIISRGRLLTGAHGMAGEAGHVAVCATGAPCGCGGKDHSETAAAADGTTARALAKGLPGDFKDLWELRGTPGADEVIGVTLEALARAIASAYVIMDPAMVIIGGGMSKAGGIIEALTERTKPYLSTPLKKLIDLRLSKLGSKAPLYGAAGLGG